MEAVREALDYEMSRYDDVIVLGEDVVAAGVWGLPRVWRLSTVLTSAS